MAAHWPPASASGVEFLLAVAAGAGAALLAMELVRARLRARRLRALASRASALGAPGADAPGARGRGEEAALARALEEAAARLAEDRAARDAFLDRSLEELRRPLDLLATSLELALRRRPEVPELTAALQDAQREAARIARVAARVSALRRYARGVARAPLDLVPLARDAVQLAQGPAARGGLTVVLESPPSAPLPGDAAALRQALSELLDNALRVTRFGGRVTLVVVRRGDLVRLEVRDGGPGIPAARREEVFSPFARGAPGAPGAAVPLGLALVRAIALAHGGAARAEPTGAAGALVVVELPAVA